MRWSDEEWAAVVAAAGRVGVKPARFVAEATLAAADGVEGPQVDHGRDAVAQLLATRTELTRAGTNLNQAVHRFHATGEPPAWLADAVAEVTAAVERVDEVTAEAGAAVRRRSASRRRRHQRARAAAVVGGR